MGDQTGVPRRTMTPEVEAELVARLNGLADQMAWGKREVLLFRLSHRGFVQISVSGPFGSKEIGHLIRLLEVQRDMLAETGDQLDGMPGVRA